MLHPTQSSVSDQHILFFHHNVSSGTLNLTQPTSHRSVHFLVLISLISQIYPNKLPVISLEL